MSLTIGIAGLPNVGKSTLFNALTRATVLAANYPFATIEPNVGVVPLPDPRLNKLAEIFGSQRILPATVSFVDIAGIVRGASEGEGLGNQFLANIREADAICQVTRAFSDPDVVHVDGKVDPASDIETIKTELILADMQTVEKQIPRLEKEVRGKKTEPIVLETARQALELLERGELLSGPEGAKLDQDALRSFQLMTSKPFIFVFNMDAAEMDNEEMKDELRALVAPAVALSHPLVRRPWFARAQFASLHLPEELYEPYYRDSCAISKRDMIAFMRANSSYRLKPELAGCRALATILVGGKEPRIMVRSARALQPASSGFSR